MTEQNLELSSTIEIPSSGNGDWKIPVLWLRELSKVSSRRRSRQ